MSTHRIDRRTFLKVMGVTGSGLFVTGCDSQYGVSLEVGKETVTGYVDPQEFVIPGDEVWYASTCYQCPGGCGIHARVLEGRVRKLEGNPDSPINQGGLCSMGQAGLQHHYNPDRLYKPLARREGRLQEITWEEARRRLAELMAQARANGGERFALLTGGVSGHLAALMTEFMQALGGGRHHVYEPLTRAVAHAAETRMLDSATLLQVDRARLVVSFGADFLGTWESPVHFGAQYGRFRDAPRGTLVQIEPKMSVTGANADWWRPIRPGTEGWLILGVARLVAQDPAFAKRLPSHVRASLEPYDLDTVSHTTDIPADQIERLATALKHYRPSLVLVGGPAESHEQGSRNVTAGLLLNALLGNFGETITSAGQLSRSQLACQPGVSADLLALAETLPALDTLFVYGTNPLYTAPDFLGLEQKLGQVPTKVVFASVADETTLAGDLVIPVRSYLEDWGTRVPAYNPEPGTVHVQQPVMQPLSADVPAFGDLLLDGLRAMDSRFAHWDNFYAYVRAAVEGLHPDAEQAGFEFSALPALLKPPVFEPTNPLERFSPTELDARFWEAVVAQGLFRLPAAVEPLRVSLPTVTIEAPAGEPEYPFHLIPTPRLGLYDGRHANLPWLQEVPDQLTKLVWDSWAEIHPEAAAALGIEEGDLVEIASPHGRLEVKAVPFAGVHPEAVAVPLGQGHTVGRYAQGVGVNPWKILSPKLDAETGELALYATRVKVAKTGRREAPVKLQPTAYQHERRLVRTVSARGLRDTSKES